MINLNSTGVIYAVSNEKYAREAYKSVRSLKQHNPNTRSVIFTNTDTNIHETKYFDDIRIIDDVENRIKIQSMILSPFKISLFLDTDTFICGPLDELFNITNRFDLAAAHAPIRKFPVDSSAWGGYTVEGIPNTFPEFNTGVLLFKDGNGVRDVLLHWLSLYDRYREGVKVRIPDQPAFQKAVYESDLRVATLPPECNFRFIFPGYVEDNVRILHGRSDSIERIAQRLNRKKGPRVFVPGIGVIHKQNLFVRIIRKLRSLMAT